MDALHALVDYQPESIVSRKIIQKPAGSVTVFAFDQGEEFSEHSAAYDALLYLIEGEAEIRIAGQPHTVKAGEVLMLPANKPHAVKALTRFKMLLTMIRS
jgi:quercetin dioxygenase-like cupin family protein